MTLAVLTVCTGNMCRSPLAESDDSVTLTDLPRARLDIDADDPALDVEDPIGREPEVFDRTGAQISAAVDSIVRLLARG